MSIKSILDKLTSEQRSRLIHAFDHHFSQHIELEDNKFVGVNIVDVNFEIEESVGSWSHGRITR